MGEMEVPADALYGASTQRAVLNFPISGERPAARASSARSPWSSWPPPRRTRELGLLDADVAAAIAAAARGGRRRRLRRPVPDRHLPDRLRDLDEHEHERGRRPPRRRAARRPAGPPERRRQPLPELERHDPDRAPAVGRDRHRGGAAARPRAPPHRARRQGAGVLAGRQDRPDAPPGRHADPPRPGVPRLRRPGRGIAPPGPCRAGRAARRAARRDRGRDRHQRPSRVRVPGLRPAVDPDRADRPRDRQPLPRPGHDRRRHRGPRRDPDDRA